MATHSVPCDCSTPKRILISPILSYNIKIYWRIYDSTIHEFWDKNRKPQKSILTKIKICDMCKKNDRNFPDLSQRYRFNNIAQINYV